MKVSQLIKELRDCHPNFEVYLEDENYNIKPLLFTTSSLYTEPNGRVVLVVNYEDYGESKINKK